MTKCLAQLTPAELAEYLFRHRDQDIEFTFYANYDPVSSEPDPVSGEPEWAYLVKICEFADARSLFINYVGGGNLFCYEFGDDSDASCLTGLLATYAAHNGFETDLWAQLPPEFKKPAQATSGASTKVTNVTVIVEAGSVVKAYANDDNTVVHVIDKDINIEDIQTKMESRQQELNEAIHNGWMHPIGIS